MATQDNLLNDDVNNEEDDDYSITNWDELDLDPRILRGIYAEGFERPSPIQQKAIKPIMIGRDIVAQAQSGTGKTCTFAVGGLSRIKFNENSTQVMVLSPTRELTTQTASVFNKLACMIPEFKLQILFGGSLIEEGSIFSTKNIPHVICGCAGRVYDMLRRDKINAKNIKLVILDEADEMLSSGFKEQVYNIFQYLNQNVQVALFSATLPPSIDPIIKKIMRNHIKIEVKREMLTLEGIRQYYIAIDDDLEKYTTLKDLFSYLSVSQCIIYCNSIRRVIDLYSAMKEDDYPVCCIHSNMDKTARDNAFNDFRNGNSRVMISSNVTARGIDIQQVSIVINFDLPKCVDNYLHRIGRSGRWGRKGVGINFITRRDINKMKEIEKHYSSQIMEMPTDLAFLKSI
jgi:translation initiation factor 4A